MRSLLAISAGCGLAFFALGGSVHAQTASLSAPTLGYVYDAESKSLRLISGIPGASTLEGSVALATKIEQAHVAPNRKSALAETLEGSLLLLRLSGRDADAIGLEGALASPDLVAFNASGDAAALYDRKANRLQVWTGLSASPALERQFDVPELRAIALSDSGNLAGAGESGVVLWTGAESRVIAEPGNFSALVFSRNGQLIGADANRILLLGNEPELLSNLEGATALGLSVDGRSLFALTAESILRIALDTRASDRIDCPCRNATLSPLQGNTVFRLTGLDTEQFLIYDAGAEQPRILMIPHNGGRQ